MFLHAVEDEPQEDEGVVAVVCVQVPDPTLAQLSEVFRLGELALVHKAGPGADGLSPTIQPVLHHTARHTLRKQPETQARKSNTLQC